MGNSLQGGGIGINPLPTKDLREFKHFQGQLGGFVGGAS